MEAKFVQRALENLGIQSFVIDPDTLEYQVIGTNDVEPTEEEFQAAYDTAVAEEPMRKLRKRRDAKLAECDWVTIKAYSQGVVVPAEWAEYQQALRDITETYTSLDDVVWPTKPE
jgi:hypothetical protein